VAGEIRDTGSVKTKMWQILGSLLFLVVVAGTFTYLLTSRVGTELLSSAAYLYYNAPDQSPIPVSPFFGFFVAAMANNPIIAGIAAVTIFTWMQMAIPNGYIYGSRALLAMAMDRVVPAWVGKIHPRYHSPVNAIFLLGVVSLIFAWAYAYTDFWMLSLSAGLIGLIVFSLTCFAAAIWPYYKPVMYNSTPIAKYKIGGIPAVTCTGGLACVISLWVFYIYVSVPALGVASVAGYIFNIAMIVVSAIMFYAFKYYRKSRESLDVSMAYKEIPPE
jgi:amino acid transporter